MASSAIFPLLTPFLPRLKVLGVLIPSYYSRIMAA
jgi:hypothetical protein